MALQATAQPTSKVIIFSNNQMPFYLFINDIVQNEEPAKRVIATNIKTEYSAMRILFEGDLPEEFVQSNIYTPLGETVTYQIKRNYMGKFTLQYVGTGPNDGSADPTDLNSYADFIAKGTSSSTKSPTHSTTRVYTPPSVLEKKKNLTTDERYFKALSLIEEGGKEVVQAKELLEGILDEDPTYGKAHYSLAKLYEGPYKEPKKARDNYKLALEASPTYPDTYCDYAAFLAQDSEYAEAQSLLDKALDIQGTNKSRIYRQYGILHELQQQYDLALEHFQKAVQFAMTDAEVQLANDGLKRCEKKRDILAPAPTE